MVQLFCMNVQHHLNYILLEIMGRSAARLSHLLNPPARAELSNPSAPLSCVILDLCTLLSREINFLIAKSISKANVTEKKNQILLGFASCSTKESQS